MKISTKSKKIILVAFAVITAAAITSLILCNAIIDHTAQGKLYTEVDAVPFKKTGLLLGTSKFVLPGRPNPYYVHRISAAVKLLKAGKIKYIVISGDSGRTEYNEPEAMRQDLVNAGIDSTIIYLDYAGFRTYDSMIRLKKIFGQTDVTIISQQFHNERAIYIAKKLGMTAIGFNARAVGDRKTGYREKLARVKVFVDFIFGARPKFLGERIVIPA